MTENLNESDNSGTLSDYERMPFEDKIASEKKKKLLIAIILILSIIIIVTISIFLIFYFLNRPSGKEPMICLPGYFNPSDDSTKEPNPQSPIPNPQSPIPIKSFQKLKHLNYNLKKINKLFNI